GTTAVGFVYQGGIVLCADSKVTQGNVILSKIMLKALPVGDHIMATVAGASADCSFWIRTLAWESRLHELKYGEPLSLLAAATIISNVSLDEWDNGRNLYMGMILAGMDESGPGLVRINCDGFIVRGTLFAVGSGSERALEILNTGFDFDLSDQQAFDLGFRAVCHASIEDAYTGGSVSLHHMVKNTWKTLGTKTCKELHENFK
ncbi:hypothetical protein KR059_004974, partial [Drosophila kikkawai]